MKNRIVCSIILTMFLLTSCTHSSTGVTYPKISENRFNYVRNDMTQVSWSTLLLNYDGRIYTGTVLQSDGASFDTVCDKELGVVYGYDGVFWADSEEKITAVEAQAQVYSVKGYDSDFRLCIYREDSDTLFLFENLNGVTVSKGSDVFEKKLRLNEYETVEVVKNGRPADEKLDVDNFLTQIFEADMLPLSENESVQEGKECLYEVIFYDRAGIPNTLKVYDGGYVVYEALGADSTYRFLVKI